MDARRLPPALAVFAVALGVRLLFLAGYADNPFFAHRGLDAVDYHLKALGFLAGTWPAAEAFFWPPLYSLFLALVYQLAGQPAAVATLVQLVLGSVSCALVVLVAGELFGGVAVPLAAGLICALSGTLIFHDAQLLPDALDVLLQLLALAWLLRAGRSPRLRWWGLAGLAAGLSAVNRGSVFFFIPVVAAWAWVADPAAGASPLRPAVRRRAAAWRLAVFCAPVLLVLSPVTLHNLRHDDPTAPAEAGLAASALRLLSGRFVLVSANTGINFRLGNLWEQRALNDVGNPAHFPYYRELIDSPAALGIRSASGSQRHFVRETLRDLARRPADLVRLAALKLRQAVGGHEIQRNANPYAYRRYSPVLAALLWEKVVAFPAGLVIPLGLAGLLFTRLPWRRALPFHGLLGAHAAVLLTFFVTSRYRLVPLCLLAVPAAWTLCRFAALARQRALRALAAPLSLVLALGLASNAGVGVMDERHAFYERNNLAQALLGEGRLEEAAAQLGQVLAMFPDHYGAAHNLGLIAARRERWAEAEQHFRRAIRAKPRFAPAHHRLGVLLAQEDRVDEARAALAETLSIEPGNAEAHFDLGKLLLGEGKAQEALAFLSEAVRLRPDQAAANLQLSRALEALGRGDEAAAYLEKALHLDPDLALR